MAVRPIDGNDFMWQLTLDTSKGHYGEFMDGSEVAFTSREIAAVVEQMPTLTQPNEPLTWEELEKLKSSPVYIDMIGVNSYWALVRDINDCGVWLMTVDDIDDYGSHRLYGKTWLAYRRPPEGEEEKP